MKTMADLANKTNFKFANCDMIWVDSCAPDIHLHLSLPLLLSQSRLLSHIQTILPDCAIALL